MPELNFDFANAAKLMLPVSGPVNLILVGCGGTGSWLAPTVARTARLLVETRRRDARVFFVDPDRVESKNVYRQNFCDAEVGQNKALTLGYRFGMAWGVPVTAVQEQFVKIMTDNYLTIVIGCVDNAAARRSIQEAVSGRRIWWLDCGNAKANGQVLLGCGATCPNDPFELPGFCSWLPMPTIRHPELLEPLPDENANAAPMSCAEMALVDSQGLAINQAVATIAGDYLLRMLLTQDLRRWATYINLESATMRSEYIVPGKMAAATASVSVETFTV